MGDIWLIIGAGVSGFGAAKLLRAKGRQVRVSEGKALDAAASSRFTELDVDLCDGGHQLEHLAGITHVVLSPGLPREHLLVAAARRQNLPLISEIDLALREYTGCVIGVTGTNGKSTTCAMLGQILSKAGHSVSVGGNFGDPPTLMLAEGRIGDFLVLELSSYQLEQSSLVVPQVAVFTSFSHDHIARHGSLSAYFAAKWRLFAALPPGSLALMTDEVWAQALAFGYTLDTAKTSVVHASAQLRDLAPGSIASAHDRLNAGFALAAASHVLNRPVQQLQPLLAAFRGLPHRCEIVGYRYGEPVTNDSKSTNVESTLVALQAQEHPVILLMGGQGKEESYTPILAAAGRIKAVICFGASGGQIAEALRPQLTVQEFPTLRDAFAQIGGIIAAYPGGILFSPGCASFDEFRNYEERGEYFRAAMQPWLT